MTKMESPTEWIRHAPRNPPMIYLAHPVAAQPGEVLATCIECGAQNTFARGDAVDLRTVCDHDAPVRQISDAAAIVNFNLARALRWWRWFHVGIGADVVFVLPWYVNVTANGENDPALIERGLRDDCEVVKRCDAIILCGPRISSGMYREAQAAIGAGIDVFQVDGVLREPPRRYMAAASTPWIRWSP